MMRDLSELNKLEKYLKEKGMRYERYDDDGKPIIWCDTVKRYDQHQIIAVGDKGEYLWDAICHEGSYGCKEGLIEVMGEALIGHGDVEGHLTAEDVIAKIEGRKE